ncbi:MAG: 4-alpha-glucanotransferase [Lachnospiraceae bacterium]|nr:4-alpha-glucanotransferase [Lachnospiraceae bacterium]
MQKRESGVLLPIFSLPSNYGIGCFSKEAYQFVDMLQNAGQKKWQILPLGPTGYGDSPYQSFSTFAGNPYFIDLESLIQEGLLSQEECAALDFGNKADEIDYEKLYHGRFRILELAYSRFQQTSDYERFVETNAWWLDDYSLYMAIKDTHDGASWCAWPKEHKNREPKAMETARKEQAKQMDFYRFQQYQFTCQWDALHKYATEKGIAIIGDLPIYVAFDSADTWANPALFQFDVNKEPTGMAGCPPDYFAPTGQLWGNPLYDWAYHKETNYAWWFQRIAHAFQIFDVVRIDHFRGFDTYYRIPAGREDAVLGAWLPGPSIEFFKAVKARFGDLKIIAEDLGFLTDSVLELLNASGYPGMKVLQFAFDSDTNNVYLPHNYTNNCVVYTGTHDNDTTAGWLDTIDLEEKKFVQTYLQKLGLSVEEKGVWALIALAMGSPADLCVIPMQDYLGLGSHSRINTPATLGGNWQWRLQKGQFGLELLEKMGEITKQYGRV